MGLKGVQTYCEQSPAMRSAFRTTFTQPEGKVSAWVFEALVLDIDLAAWTVDVISKHDQLIFQHVQVAAPYLHPNRGDGFYCLPEVGAKCMVCIPSDGPPAFVLCFIMPQEQVVSVSTEGEVFDERIYTYAGGRTRPKPGDIMMRGRDGNFICLHRGGVLQIGSTELAQRIYIPLQNIVEDISQVYRHYNAGGAINWGLRAGDPEDELATSFKQTFRLFADEEEATVRVCVGTFDPMVEATADWSSDLSGLEIGDDNNPVVYEVTISPGGFNPEDGAPVSGAAEGTTLRLLFDKNGGTFLGAHGSVLFTTKKKIKIVAEDDIYIESKKSITIKAGTTLRIEGGKAMDLTSSVTKLNGGSKPIAHVGSMVQMTLTAPVPIMVGGVPGTITAGSIMTGQILSGNPTTHC